MKVRIISSIILIFSCAIIYGNITNTKKEKKMVTAERTNCACGDHENGITRFMVMGSDCCKDRAVNGSGVSNTYEHQGNGVYLLTEAEPVTGGDAQADCCNK